MVVHQNITNLAGYFHFLNVRKIPYVIVMDATLTQITLRNSKNFFGLSALWRLWRCTRPFCKGQAEAKLCPTLRPADGHKLASTGVGQ